LPGARLGSAWQDRHCGLGAGKNPERAHQTAVRDRRAYHEAAAALAVSNRDIGFVHVGQEAQIKVDTFNFTRYGLLHGKVLSVSQDTIVHDKPQDKPGDKVPGAGTSNSEPKGQELLYSVRISLEPHPDANRRQPRQSRIWHGRHG
jgi:hypothetical protein